MNASFSILQKLKGQFLQSVPNKSAFHIAFAPFAFTLSNDDFYFLKDTTGTGAEARKYLREQSEFAVLANSVLRKPHIWRIDSDNLLYGAYRSILESALTIDPDALTADEQTRIDKAKAVLFTTSGDDSVSYQAYKKNAAKVAEAEKTLIDHSALRSTIAEADATALAKWNLDLQTLTSKKNDLLIEWQANGFKGTVESAKASYADILLSKTRFLEKWLDAKNIKLASPNLLTDEFGVEFLVTTCIPNAICEATAPIWKKITLTKPEIAQLTQSFTQEMPAEVLTEFGDLQPELDAITFEYCMVDILRPWFDESVINNQLWKFADESVRVSAGDDTMTGQVPAYPIKIILAKNIDLVFTPNAPVNEEIKVQLKGGGRLFFGPLLLKTIPTNLADDQIKGFRVQQLSKPELAVIANVAVQNADRPQSVDSGNRIEMIQLLNRRPPMEMRRNVEVKSLAAARLHPTPTAAVPITTVLSPLRPGFRPGVFATQPQPSFPPKRPPVEQPPAPAQKVTVVGKVFSSDNQPVPVAEIQIMNVATAATQSMLSLEDGTYSFRDIDAASYQVKVRKTAYVTQERVVVARGNSTQDFLLERQSVPIESFQVIGVICKKLPSLPNPRPESIYI